MILANYLRRKNEERFEENNYIEQLANLIEWNSEEGRFRKREIIKQLQKLNKYDLNLAFVDLHGDESDPSKCKFGPNFNLTDGILVNTDLSYLNFEQPSIFNLKRAHSSRFIDSFLGNSKFENAHLQGVNFRQATLNGSSFDGSTIVGETDFEDANLSFVSFNNVHFSDTVNFINAIVDQDFMVRAKDWKMTGYNIFDDYEISTWGNQRRLARIFV